MKRKYAKQKASRHRTKRGEQQRDVVVFKTESEAEDVCSHADGFDIQIKEEPHAQEIGEEHNGDPSCCPGLDTATAEALHVQEHVKVECDEHLIKEEPESWVKEEQDSGEEEAQGVCTGRCSTSRGSLSSHTILWFGGFIFIFILLLQSNCSTKVRFYGQDCTWLS